MKLVIKTDKKFQNRIGVRKNANLRGKKQTLIDSFL